MLKKIGVACLMVAIVSCLVPVSSFAAIQVDMATRELDAYVEHNVITGYTCPILFCLPGTGDPVYTLVTDNPAPKVFTGTGAVNDSITASVDVGSIYSEIYSATASQNSNISLIGDTLTGTASIIGDIDPGGSTTNSLFIDFSIDSGMYAYNFEVFKYILDWNFNTVKTAVYDGYVLSLSNDFAANTTGVIGPGSYQLGITFNDISTGAYGYPYNLSFVVSPSSVPEPGILFLFGSGLVGLIAGRMFRRKEG